MVEITNTKQISKMITCECGAHIRKTGKNEHCKSTKHQDYILSKNTIQIL